MTIAASPFLKADLLWSRGRWEQVSRWFPEGHLILVPSGREAIYRTLGSLGVSAGDAVLLPSYICKSVLAPVAKTGAIPRFYTIREDLSVDLDHLERLTNEGRPKALLLIHYFGFPDPRLDELLRLARERNIAVIEDCAHAMFGRLDGRPLGSLGDAGVFSLKKTLPAPGGGVLRLPMRADLGQPEDGHRVSEAGAVLKLMAYALEARLPFSVRGWLLASSRVRQAAYSNDESRPVATENRMGTLSWKVLASSSPEYIVARRHENFTYALERLNGLDTDEVRPIFSGLPDEVCPLGVPILVRGDRESLRRWLYRRGMLLPAIWEVLPDEVPLDQFPDSQLLMNRILMIPVHQGLGTREVDRMVTAIGEWLRR